MIQYIELTRGNTLEYFNLKRNYNLIIQILVYSSIILDNSNFIVDSINHKGN